MSERISRGGSCALRSSMQGIGQTITPSLRISRIRFEQGRPSHAETGCPNTLAKFIHVLVERLSHQTWHHAMYPLFRRNTFCDTTSEPCNGVYSVSSDSTGAKQCCSGVRMIDAESAKAAVSDLPKEGTRAMVATDIIWFPAHTSWAWWAWWVMAQAHRHRGHGQWRWHGSSVPEKTPQKRAQINQLMQALHASEQLAVAVGGERRGHSALAPSQMSGPVVGRAEGPQSKRPRRGPFNEEQSCWRTWECMWRSYSSRARCPTWSARTQCTEKCPRVSKALQCAAANRCGKNAPRVRELARRVCARAHPPPHQVGFGARQEASRLGGVAGPAWAGASPIGMAVRHERLDGRCCVLLRHTCRVLMCTCCVARVLDA